VNKILRADALKLKRVICEGRGWFRICRALPGEETGICSFADCIGKEIIDD